MYTTEQKQVALTLFAFAIAQVREQGAPSMGGDSCLYRGPEGRKCAAGFFIPDADYRESFDAMGSNSVESLSFFDTWPENKRLALRAAQRAHDSAAHRARDEGLPFLELLDLTSTDNLDELETALARGECVPMPRAAHQY